MAEEPEMETPTQPRFSVKPWRLFLWLPLIFLFYVLSIGPVALLFETKLLPQTWENTMGIFYSPLLKPWESGSAIGKPVGIYLHLWIPDEIDIHGNVNFASKP